MNENNDEVNTNKIDECNKKKPRRIKIKTILFIIIDVFIVFCFVLFYGTNAEFRDLIITTAMNTKTHQYLAYVFWDEETVETTLRKSAYIPIDEAVNLDDIVIDTAPKEYYSNVYEETIMTRDPGNEDYKYIKVKVGDYDGHLVAIYDPSKVHLIHSKTFNTGTGQEKIKDMCNRYGATVCINGGMFVDNGVGSDIPLGYLISDGKIIWSHGNNVSNLIGFTNDNKLLLTTTTGTNAIKNGMRDALEFGPFLIVNGKPLQFVDPSSGGTSRAARVAIAQRKDGIVLFLVTEGYHVYGPTYQDVIDVLLKYGAYNAANLDGGTSTQLTINGQLMNNPLNIYGQKVDGGRRVVSGFGLIP